MVTLRRQLQLMYGRRYSSQPIKGGIMADERGQPLDEELVAYRTDYLDRADALREALDRTHYLKRALPTASLEEGRRVIDSIGPGNENPVFPKLFLFLLRDPDRIPTINAWLVAVSRLAPRDLQEVITRLGDAPEGMFAELSVFAAVTRNGGEGELFPEIPGTNRKGDLLMTRGPKRVFVEVTVLTQGVF